MLKSSILAFGLLFVVAVECSDIKTPQPCCTAEQFEISFGGVVGMVSSSGPAAYKEFFTGAFDFDSRQYGMDVHVHIYGETSAQYKVIQLFEKGEQYIIQDGLCTRMAPVGEPQRCVPDEVKYTTSFYLGNQALLLDDWHQSGDIAQGVKGDVYATTSSDDCTPGPVSFVGTQDVAGEKASLTSSGTYLNFTKGISDPDRWFVPPPSCGNATRTFLKDEGKLFHIQHWRRMQATQMLL